MTAQPFLHLTARAHPSRSFPQNLLQHHGARVNSKNSNGKPEHITELESIHIFQPFTLLLPRAQIRLTISEETSISCPQVPFHSIYQQLARLDRRFMVRLEISNQKPNHIAQLRSISTISKITSMARPEHIPINHPRKFPSCAPSHIPFSNSLPAHPLPHTHPSTNINHPPSFLQLAPPLLHLTHGLYQAALGGHTGHTALVFKSESHYRVQSPMHLCIQLCAEVKKGLHLPPNSHSLFSLSL